MPAREWRVPFCVASLALAADATILRFFGRRWWCACGSPVPWSLEVNSRHNSQHLVDAYSPTHVLHGLVFYGLSFLVARRAPLPSRFAAVAIAEAIWEMVENSSTVIERYRAATISLDYYGDSILNSLSDVLFCLFGFWLASRLPPWASVVLFIAVELALVVTIHDSLTLNVIMLLWPLDAIRRWQSGP